MDQIKKKYSFHKKRRHLALFQKQETRIWMHSDRANRRMMVYYVNRYSIIIKHEILDEDFFL